jgi:hypothetical protein
MKKFLLAAAIAAACATSMAQDVDRMDRIDIPYTVAQFRNEYLSVNPVGKAFMRGYILGVVDMMEATRQICPKISDLSTIAQAWLGEVIDNQANGSQPLFQFTVRLVRGIPGIECTDEKVNNSKDRNIL